ncbi:TetR/AcrR family transcriptional regulator [Cohaesibacter haloalkalitolerans]|uniref:TetR/AcrR family transcriptional regulator n=1 Tax=Cohaesibacter haloalkalitolerans TaxID=1162980 RepID=UPI0013C50E81|nr:TetR/AcrR family transcriptional regulator [Cohaesibacter haloalkalitolerans]
MSRTYNSEEEPPHDIRIERTRARLAEAVLTLAAESDIAGVSVAELARRAGVNRSTFYDHAQSPVELLTRVLSQDLDHMRRTGMEQLRRDGQLLRYLTRSTLREIIRHVVRHEAIYAGPSCSSSTFALRVVLAEHIEQSMLTILGEGFVSMPVADDQLVPLMAAFLGHGAAGAIEAWLGLPSPRDEDRLLSTIEAMYPPWLAPVMGTEQDEVSPPL